MFKNTYWFCPSSRCYSVLHGISGTKCWLFFLSFSPLKHLPQLSTINPLVNTYTGINSALVFVVMVTRRRLTGEHSFRSVQPSFPPVCSPCVCVLPSFESTLGIQQCWCCWLESCFVLPINGRYKEWEGESEDYKSIYKSINQWSNFLALLGFQL